MKHNLTSALGMTVIGVVLAASRGASAAPLDVELLPRDAKWVIHVNYEALSDSAIAERVRERRPDDVRSFQQWCEENCGLNPERDLQSITLYGSTYQPHSGTAVLCADFNEAQVRSALEKKPRVQRTEEYGCTFYTWTRPTYERNRTKIANEGANAIGSGASGNATRDVAVQPEGEAPAEEYDAGQIAPQGAKQSAQQMTAVLLDGKRAVLACTLESAQEAVRLIKGEAAPLKKDAELVADLPDGAIAYGAAIDLKDIGQHQRLFSILEQHKRVAWVIGERGEEMFETLELEADRAKTAREMEKAVEGFVALAKVWAGDLEELTELYDDTEISRDGSTVRVEWEGDVSDVLAALDELQPRFQAWREYYRQYR